MNFYQGVQGALACIFSVSGLRLNDEERALFRQVNPFGFILFARNCETPAQVRALVSELKEAVGRDCPILTDQEGGRVQRLGPPHWGMYKPMKTYGDELIDDSEGTQINLQNDTDRLCEGLVSVGINVNCAPVLDVLTEQTHDIIGDRAFSDDPNVVAALGILVCERFLHNDMTPVIKHIPGHGRAASDSHHDLPVVDTPRAELELTDFLPFQVAVHCAQAHSFWAMTAHVIYSDIDPEHPASVSPVIIQDVIRDTIGFKGILVSDDLDMKALDQYGDVSERCLKTLEAGCDVALYCAGEMDSMQKIAETCPKLGSDTLARLQKAGQMWEAVA